MPVCVLLLLRSPDLVTLLPEGCALVQQGTFLLY
jgi:hypothetical protein